MAIYISKDAIKHNPFVEEEIQKEERKYPPLVSVILKDVKYLVNLMEKPKSVKYLKKTNTLNDWLSIVRVKMTLNAIHLYSNTFNNKKYSIPGGKLFDTSKPRAGIFNEKLFNAIVAFQDFVSINNDGVIGPETLHYLDVFIINDQINFDTNKNELIGKTINKSLKIEQTVSNGNFTYTIEINDKKYVFTSTSPLEATLIESPKEDEFAILSDPDIIKNVIDQNDITGTEREIIENSSYARIESFKTAELKREINKFEDITPELDLTPPRILPKEQARLYLVKDGDSPISIIQKEYYNEEDVVLENNFSEDANPIYTFKAQKLNSNPKTREHDAKLQFYLNLIYYYNSVEEEDDNIKEYGIAKTSNYQRYDDDHLNEFEMFANTFDKTKPETALPNYYRFLKFQESKGSKIEFDGTTGETTSFTTQPGKFIYIPSREYADSLYYHLNFRHKEMLVEEEDGYSYLEDNAFIRVASDITLVLARWIGAADELLDFVISEADRLLKATADFFKKAYEFVKYLIDNWPRGIGGELRGGIGATWGFIAGDIDVQPTFYRKVKSNKELVFVLRQFNKGFVGVDVGVGGSFGFKTGSGKSKKVSSGIQVGAGVKAGLEFTLTSEYEFPMRQEETALLALLIQVFGGTVTKIAAKLTGSLIGINLDPTQYLTYMKIGTVVKADVWGVAQFGIKENGKADEEKNVVIDRQPASNKKDKSFFSITNIWSILSGVGVATEGQVALGSEFEYLAKYDKKPLIPEVSGRVPSKGEVKNFYFVSGQLKTVGIGSFLKRLLMSSKIEALLNFLSFETGIGIGSIRSFDRNVKANEIELSDVNNPEDQSEIDIQQNDGKVKYGNEKITWEKQLVLARFTGDVDALFVPGSETALKLNTYKLIKILRSDKNEDFFSFKTLDAVLSIIHSIELQFKPSVINTGKEQGKLNFVDTMTNTLNSNFEPGVRKKFVSRKASLNYKGVSAELYAGAYVKVEFKISELKNLIQYYIKYWYLVLKANIIDDETVAFQNSIKEEVRKIYKTDLKEANNSILSKEKYEKLFEKLNKFIDTLFEENDLIPDSFKEAVLELFNVSRYLLQYVNNKDIILKPKQTESDLKKVWKDMDIQRFTNAFVAMAGIIDTEAYFEAKAGLLLSLDLSAAFGAKFRLSGSFGGALVIVYSIIEENKLVFLEDEDPDKKVMTQLGNLLGVDETTRKINDKPTGIRKAIISLPH